jgi:hypothetical protein
LPLPKVRRDALPLPKVRRDALPLPKVRRDALPRPRVRRSRPAGRLADGAASAPAAGRMGTIARGPLLLSSRAVRGVLPVLVFTGFSLGAGPAW